MANTDYTDTTKTTGTLTTVNTVIDSQSPYFLHPADHPNLVLVSNLFTGNNYYTWQRNMRRALNAKNKLGFVSGSIPRNDIILADAWDRCSDVVLSWLLNSIDSTLTPSLTYCNIAIQLLNELCTRFTQDNSAEIYRLELDIGELTQCSYKVTQYYNKLMKKWEELALLDTAEVLFLQRVLLYCL